MKNPDSISPIDTFGRVPEYIELLEKAREEGICLLDIDGFRERQGEDILREVGGWVLARILHPYPNTAPKETGVEGHTLIFPKRHISNPKEMTGNDLTNAWELFNDAADIYGAKTGALFLRYSFDGNYVGAGSTIDHIHFHVVSPYLDPQTNRVPGANSKDSKQVRFSVG